LQQARTINPFGYIIKPFENVDLLTAIEIALSRHQAEIKIQQSLAQEKQLRELKSNFVSVVSHEFRTPLSVIRVAIDLLEQAGKELPLDTQKNYLRRVRLSVQQMNQLLEEVLVVGESDLGRLECHPISLDLSSFCSDLVEEIQSITTSHSIHFRQCWEHPDNWVSVDEKLLRCILTNLLSNAIKYSPQGGNIFFNLIVQSNLIWFQIQDPGIGIPIMEHNKLFTTFYRATNVAKIRGTGLGLSIVKQCVETCGGEITVESEVGKGSVFTVTLPIQG
jgi:signal transduction histidine kinase